MNRFGACLAVVIGTGVLAPVGATAASAQVAPHQSSDVRPSDRSAKPRQVVVRPGKYRGNFYTSSGKRLEEFTFTVTKNRKVKKFSAALNVTCSYYPPTVETHPLMFPTTPIKATGKFNKVWTPDNDSRIVLTGKLKKAKLISGSLDYTVGVCVRTAQLKARRVGK